MRKFLFSVWTLVMLFMVSCSDITSTSDAPEVSVGLYVLNSGKYGNNNASLTYYDMETGAATQGVFAAVNGMGLGDTGQDMIIYGSKMYIAVYNSGVIFVTDLTGKIVETIKHDTYNYPRSLTSSDGYVYATYYDGAVAKMDTTSYSIQTTVTGEHPEGLAVANGNVYVAISGSWGNYDNQIEVFDASTLTKSGSVEVAVNPSKVEAAPNGDIYVLSLGNYYDVLSSIQCIDSNSDVTDVAVATTDEGYPLKMIMNEDGMLYVAAGISDYTTDYKLVGDIYSYDCNSKIAKGAIITDATTISDIYMISANSNNGDVYVGTSDYTNTGELYLINEDGEVYDIIDTGINPMVAVAVTAKDEE